MDVANYLSELLGQLGEVNVPGLGYFVQSRLNGYYNEANDTFYPPKNKVQFDPQYMEDDVLIQYIADKKNISLASSRYFTEKYITNIKQEAQLKDMPLADLGWLYTDKAHIAFRPVEVMVNDASVFGYPEIKLSKLGGTSFFEQLEAHTPPSSKRFPQHEPAPEHEYLPEPELPPAPVLTDEPLSSPAAETFTAEPEIYQPEPEMQYFQPEAHRAEPEVPQPEHEIHQPIVEAYQPPVETYTHPQEEVYIPPVRPEEQEEFIFHGKNYDGNDEEEVGRSYAWIWITLIVLAVLALAAFGLYWYKPSLFDRFRGKYVAPVTIKAPVKPDTIKNLAPINDTIKDTTKKAATITDTTAKAAATVTAPAVNDTLSQIRYELLGGAFGSVEKADVAIKNYKKLGIDARILNNVPGKLYKVTLGTFFVKKEAVERKNNLINTGKISESRILIQPYYPEINPKQ